MGRDGHYRVSVARARFAITIDPIVHAIHTPGGICASFIIGTSSGFGSELAEQLCRWDTAQARATQLG